MSVSVKFNPYVSERTRAAINVGFRQDRVAFYLCFNTTRGEHSTGFRISGERVRNNV